MDMKAHHFTRPHEPVGTAPTSNKLPYSPPKLTVFGSLDGFRIDVSEPCEVRYWCREFSCTEAQLRAAVKAIGVTAADLRRHFAS